MSGRTFVFALLATAIIFSAPVRAEWLTGVTARATSSQVAGLTGPQNLLDDRGLKETAPGSGRFQLTTNIYAEKGCMWHSGYISHGGDENPIVEFDLGKVVSLAGMHVWNHNAQPSRGFQEVLVTYSQDGQTWRSASERLTFAKAPREEAYTGEEYRFGAPLMARWVRLHCLSTYRQGGVRELAGLGKVRFIEASGTASADAAAIDDGPFPHDAGAINVRRAPYNAQGDGVADDTEALQRAIDDWQGTRRILYLPAGKYLISKPLAYQPGKGHGYNNLQGAGRNQTVIQLKDGVFTDPQQPQCVLSLGFNGRSDGKGVHADWFNNNVSDLTIDVGRGNPGAIGLRYYSNNVGSLRRVTIRSGDGGGRIGLDLGYADQNGPCLIKQIEVHGFAVGVSAGATVNSQTLERLTLVGQSEAAFQNRGQCLAIRGLNVSGPAAGFFNGFGIVALVDAHFRGEGPAAERPAITNRETLFARNITAEGYRTAIEDLRENGTPGVAGPHVKEFVSSPVLSLNEGPRESLSLPVEETPEAPLEPPSRWANVRHYRQLDDPDDSACVQRAIDSGAKTIYFPAGGVYYLGEPVVVRGNVERIVGMFANLAPAREDELGLVIGAGASPTVIIQDLVCRVKIRHEADRTLALQNMQGGEGEVAGAGKLHLENVVAPWTFGKGQAWCRQYNTEKEGTHAVNRGGDLWVLGLKTERGGTLIDTHAGGRTEVIGGLSYTTTQGGLAPMFVVADGELSVTLGEVCYTGDPYKTLVQETRGGQTKVLRRQDAPLRPAFLQGSQLPLFVSGRE